MTLVRFGFRTCFCVRQGISCWEFGGYWDSGRGLFVCLFFGGGVQRGDVCMRKLMRLTCQLVF